MSNIPAIIVSQQIIADIDKRRRELDDEATKKRKEREARHLANQRKDERK